MKYMDHRKKQLIEEISRIEGGMPSEVRKVVMRGIATYFKALRTFGPASPLAKVALKSIQEILQINKTEKRLLDYIINNLAIMDVEAAKGVVDSLDELNTQTISDYRSFLDGINNACDKKDDERTLLPEGSINSVLSNKKYKTMVIGLTETMRDVRSFLPYEQEFWTFIENYLKVVPQPADIAAHTCGLIPIVDEDKNLVNFYTLVPKVVDLDTAMLAIEIYKKAHDYYLCLGSKLDTIAHTTGASTVAEYEEHLDERAKMVFR